MQINNQCLTNYSKMCPKADRKVSDIQYYKQSNSYNQNVNFTGIKGIKMPSISVLKRNYELNKPLWKNISSNFREYYQNEFPEFSTAVPIDKIIEIAKENKLKVKSKNFLLDLVSKSEPEMAKSEESKSNAIYNTLTLFKRVKNPEKPHSIYIHCGLTINDIKLCFDACKDNSGRLVELNSIRKDINSIFSKEEKTNYKENSKKIFMDLVKSQNREEYIDNYQTVYRNYIVDGIRNNEYDVVSKMDVACKDEVMLSRSLPNNLYNNFKRLACNSEGSLDIKHFTPFQSEEGNVLLEVMSKKFNPSKEFIENYGDNDYVDIYRTTTKENLPFRKRFFEKNYNDVKIQNHPYDCDIKYINKLFRITDKNEDAREFVTKLLDKNYKIYPRNLVKLFDQYEPEQLNMRSKKLLKYFEPKYKHVFMEKVNGHMENNEPTFGEKISFFFAGLFKNKPRNAVRCGNNDVVEISKSTQTKGEYSYPEMYKPQQKQITEELPNEPQISIEDEIPVFIENLIEPTKKVATEKPVKKPFSLAEANKQHLLDILTNSPSKSMSKKLKIAQDSVSPVLKKNIKSEKVLNEQEYLYSINATKMRANMLPEIFESIKVTRAEAKLANGGKLPKDFVKNEDALDLYTRIKGKNKKLVEYMLKQTKKDENGKTVRAFNVKDIIQKLDDTNMEIKKAKKASTKENKFTPKDERAVFDKIFTDLKSEYGELNKKQKTKKSK